MKILDKGHKYELESMEGGEPQVIQFIKKGFISDDAKAGTLETITDGTTNEEVIAVLIDRLGYLQQVMPCRENAIAITKLDEALLWLEKRTKDRKAREVEGTINN